MLLRGANGVGYKNYPDNVVKYFVRQAAKGGIDVFRVFDCLNWVENMRVAMDAVAEEDRICEAAICYTGDILNSARPKYDLKYYTALAAELEKAGAHMIAVKDMAGLLKPAAARVLFKALKEATGLPIHFHTHDTSGIAAATVLAAVESGVDVVDAAMDALSGNTSQPCLGSIVEALSGSERDPGLDPEWIRRISFYWEAVRHQYAAFESDLKGPASEVYLHEMPGGQFTNLKEQARSLGLETRWHEVAQAYADANRMFGDIVKVTPSSKVVGDMALMMVSQDLTVADVENPGKDIAFPESVVSMLKGDLGQPPGGWPEALQKKALKGEEPYDARPGSLLEDADLDAERKGIEEKLGREVTDFEFASYLMYPKVFTDYAVACETYGPVSVLPTPAYFYGMAPGEELFADIEKGKTLVILNQAQGGDRREGHGQDVLRNERAAAFHQGTRPQPRRLGCRPPQGGSRQRRPSRRADAGRDLDRCGGLRPIGQGRRRAALHRGDEDGDGASRREGRGDFRGARKGRRSDRCEGSAGGVRGLSTARPSDVIAHRRTQRGDEPLGPLALRCREDLARGGRFRRRRRHPGRRRDRRRGRRGEGRGWP